jgi:hypothetical protein
VAGAFGSVSAEVAIAAHPTRPEGRSAKSSLFLAPWALVLA